MNKKNLLRQVFLFILNGGIEFIEIIRPQNNKAYRDDQPESGIFRPIEISEKPIGAIGYKSTANY